MVIDTPPPPPLCPVGLDAVTKPAVNLDTMYPITCPFENYIHPEHYQYSFPSFNPNDPDEIAFRHWDTESFKLELCTFNFCSGELKVIADNAIEDIDWGKSGWIVFEGTDLQIWKVKPNGEGLTRLTGQGKTQTLSGMQVAIRLLIGVRAYPATFLSWMKTVPSWTPWKR